MLFQLIHLQTFRHSCSAAPGLNPKHTIYRFSWLIWLKYEFYIIDKNREKETEALKGLFKIVL